MNRLAKIVRFSFFTFICFVELLFYPPSLKADDIPFPNFEESLLRYGKSKTCHSSYYNFATKDSNILQIRENTKKFKAIYKKNILHFTSNKSAPCRIPKIVHQIWLGSPVPDNFRILMNTWVIPGWEYKLWTDREVEQIGLYNQQLYDNAKDYGEKSDILRYEILFREGGGICRC